MLYLNLNGNTITRRGLQCLSRTIHNIEDLNIGNCQISASDIHILTNRLLTLQKPVFVLLLKKEKHHCVGVNRSEHRRGSVYRKMDS